MIHFPIHYVRRLSSGRRRKTIDMLAYVVGSIGVLAVIPQAVQAWVNPGPGLSIMTWIIFMLTGSFWLVYAISHRQKPLIFVQALGLCASAAVVLGWLADRFR